MRNLRVEWDRKQLNPGWFSFSRGGFQKYRWLWFGPIYVTWES